MSKDWIRRAAERYVLGPHPLQPYTEPDVRELEDILRAEMRAELGDVEKLRERVAQLTAHRVCMAEEHDPANGKCHGSCVVCGEDWPCEIAKVKP